MLHDAHFHLREDTLIGELRMHRIQGIANAESPDEYADLKQKLHDFQGIRISAGIHPWKADQVTWREMMPIMEEVSFIGEIGLDNVWCKVNMQKQKEIFERSLQYASDMHKPVILHLKGMEQEALSYLKRYENKYLVHWYSCLDYIQDYRELGCYFTVGPSVGKDEAVNQLVKQIPLDHLMVESDGLEALAWCEQRSVDVKEYTTLLRRSIAEIAKIKNGKESQVKQALNDTFQRFVAYGDDVCDDSRAWNRNEF